VVGTPARNGQYENSKQASASRGRTAVQKKDGIESGTRDTTHFGELVVAALVLVLAPAALVAVPITWTNTGRARNQTENSHIRYTTHTSFGKL